MVSKLVSLLLLIVLCKGLDVNKLKLKQVFIFSRHNARNTFSQILHRYSSKPWPPMVGKPGALTLRGGMLEGYMGEYFSEWFKEKNFLQEGCPCEDSAYVFANAVQRTRATARAFLDSAFKNCNVPVHHKNLQWDPLFSPAIRNTTEEYKNMVFSEIFRKLCNKEIRVKLQAAYLELNKILEIEGSDICKQNGICDLTKTTDSIYYKVGDELWVDGALRITNSIMDEFIMSWYAGVPIQNIGWGKITTEEKWKKLTEITRQDLYIRYTTVAEDIAKPLVEHLTRIFKNFDEMPQFMMIVGHDYNMNSIATSIGLQTMDLPNQFENYPIGGKLVFQRWTDGANDYLKIEHVYGSWTQLRNGTKYTLENPPQKVLRRFNWCNTDRHGFCSWEQFVSKL